MSDSTLPCDSPCFRRALWRGVLFWVAVGALGIALRGVRWDEGFERAQALLGLVPYPEGHPLRLYAWNAFSVHYYSSALLLRLTGSPLFVCGLRDLLCVWGALLPIFLIASLLTRSTRAGHLAALLILANAHTVFRSYYANDVWPFMFTSGEMGLGWAMACVGALAAGRWRLAYFLIVAMPVVHVGQMPPVLALGMLSFAGLCLYQRSALREGLRGAAAGLAVTLLFVLIYLMLRHPLPTSGSYVVSGDYADVWRRFTYFEDIHRRPHVAPRFGAFANSGMGLVAGLLLSGAWLRLAYLRAESVRAASTVFAYVVICTTAVWGVWLIQQRMGMDTPYLVIGWLPYRLSNHVAILLLCLVAAVSSRQKLPLAVLVGLAWLALRPLLEACTPEVVFTRYLEPSEGPLFLLLGAAAAALWHALAESPRLRTVWTLLATASFLALAGYQQFLAACLLLGVALHLLGHLLAASRVTGRALPLGLALGLAAIAGLLHTEYVHRQPLYASPFEREMKAWFQEHGDPAGVLLAPFWTLNYQEKTGQPVFATFETPLLIPYIPRLGPTIETMLTDAYGIRFGQPWSWALDVWVTRSAPQWRDLGERYGIRYVLSTEDYPLHLPEIMRGEGRILYEIPPLH